MRDMEPGTGSPSESSLLPAIIRRLASGAHMTGEVGMGYAKLASGFGPEAAISLWRTFFDANVYRAKRLGRPHTSSNTDGDG